MTRNFAVKAVHKDMYPATYTFRDESDGSVPSGWVDADNVGTIEAVVDGHRKVYRHTDTAANEIVYNELGDQTSGTIEFWIRFEQENKRMSLFGYRDAVIVMYLDWSAVGELKNNAGGAVLHDYDANTWDHYKIIFDVTPDTYDLWIDGVEIATDLAFLNVTHKINKITIFHRVAGCVVSFDAFGYSWDTDYKIGDNCHWRHYGESTDDFEGDDVGSQGTAITWVDVVRAGATTSIEIVQEFNEHKKILRVTELIANDWCYHSFATQAKTGFVAFWAKVSDVTGESKYMLYEGAATEIIKIVFDNSKITYYDGNLDSLIDAGDAVNNTWYYFYIQWYDGTPDTFDLWIDNILVAEGIECTVNMTSGINTIYVQQFEAGDYAYLDAPISSLDGDSRGDNRIFDYNEPYTREDITTDIQNVLYSNVLHAWRTATLLSNQDYEQTVLFFQIYDINSKLAMEAELANRVQNGQTRVYTLLDKNYDDLANLSSNTFSADDIHDPTDSTCMLKTVLPNVSEIDGDLILVNADVKTDTYSTVTKNYPDGDFLRDISDLSDAVIIIEANGKCHLDDDLASGDSLDFDNAADHSLMLGDPIINDVLDTINYFEIFGAINPVTGERFFKITDNSGDDRKRKWRITNNSFRNQTDLDAYAAKLVAKLVSVKEITISVQGLGAHNMGTTFTYKFVNAVYNVPSAAYYVIEETIDFDTAAATLVLSEGLVEGSKYAARYERPQNFSDTDGFGIWNTEITTVYLALWELAGASRSTGILLNNIGEYAQGFFITGDRVSDDHQIDITWTWVRGDAGVDTLNAEIYVAYYPLSDGTLNVITNWDAIVAEAVNGIGHNGHYVHTIVAADVHASSKYLIAFRLNEARIISISTAQVEYHTKRLPF